MRILHAGCGGAKRVPEWLEGEETRLDIDPRAKPDIVASITDMGDIGEFDVVYCAHTVEHLYPHQVDTALREFRRVLKPGGWAYVIVPDLEGIKPDREIVYYCKDGPVTGHDMYFGYEPALETHPLMAHHSGFVRETLEQALWDAGFTGAGCGRVAPMFELLGAAVK